MINLLFFFGLLVISLLLSIGYRFLSNHLDRILFRLKLDEDTLSDQNWFLKYELYRKGVGRCLENQEFTEK